MKKLILTLCVVATVLSCKNQEKKNKETVTDNSFKLTVIGTDEFDEGTVVEIYRSEFEESSEGLEYLKKGMFTDNKFEFSGTVDDPHIIVVQTVSPNSKGYPYQRIHFVLEPGETELKFTSKNTFELKGGKYNDIVINSYNKNPDYIAAINTYYKFIDATEGKELNEEERKEYLVLNGAVNNTQNAAIEKAFTSTQDTLAKLLILGTYSYRPKLSEDDYDSFVEKLALSFNNTRQGKILLKDVKARRGVRLAESQVKIGSQIKGFEAKDLEGKTFQLDDILKNNKYVLVEFWASWCGPCRAEIPHMKKAYSHFKDKGFEIVSFSLDNKREKWEKASKDEQLPWIDTSDLLAYSSPVVKMYGIRGIPANFLVESSTNKIIARDLRQKGLDEKLEELLGK